MRKATKIIDFTPLFEEIRRQELNEFGYADSMRGRQSYDVELTINRNGSTPLPVKATALLTDSASYSSEVERAIRNIKIPPWPEGSKLDHVTLNQHNLIVGSLTLRLKTRMTVLEVQTPNGSQVIQFAQPVPSPPNVKY